MKRTTKILIDGLREYLKTENLYKERDEIALQLLGNTYEQYLEASKKVKEMGAVLQLLDYNENPQYKTNPWTYVMQDLKKDMFKLLDGFYLNPKARQAQKTTTKKKNNSKFSKMMDELL
jgi:P27 family predicted phage terminase small subunit